MNQYPNNNYFQSVENKLPKSFSKIFSSIHEADLFRLKFNIEQTDQAKYRLLVKTLQVSKFFSPARRHLSANIPLLDSQLKELFESINMNKVKYLVVENLAMLFYGHTFSESVIDIWIDYNSTISENLLLSFSRRGHSDLNEIDLLKHDFSVLQLFSPEKFPVTISASIKGLENQTFEECLAKANIADLDGVKVPFLHINDLILNKKAVSRPKDQLDLIELEKIRTILQQSDQKKTS